MLTVIPKTWAYAFSVMDGAESVAQVVDLSWRDDKGELSIDGVSYTARREDSSYVLESSQGALARAEQPNKRSRELVVTCLNRQYTLRAKSSFRREFLLFEHSTQIGSISPEGLFTRKVAVKLPEEFPLFLKVFIIWLTITLWKHEAAAGAAAAAAAAAIS